MSNLYSAHHFAPGGAEQTAGLLKVVAVLCQATQGNHALLDALRQTARLIGADIVSICRVEQRRYDGSAKVLSYDARHCQTDSTRKFDISLAPEICGSNLSSAKLGSVWFGTLEDFEDQEDISELYLSRRLSESVAIPLERKNGSCDFLELHFDHPIPSAMADHLTLLGPILSDCWKKRTLGQFFKAKLSNLRSTSARSEFKNILSMENPCRLSRAEYRVCLLLAQGLNNNALLSELSITIATLRTHLRNIYVKTGTASQPELIHDLLSPALRPQSPSSGRAHVA